MVITFSGQFSNFQDNKESKNVSISVTVTNYRLNYGILNKKLILPEA